METQLARRLTLTRLEEESEAVLLDSRYSRGALTRVTTLLLGMFAEIFGHLKVDFR